ncbi:hypothetical protein HPB51_005340 [Rhipicephalus microplus]|uniref:Uncharacterized protein n=1 Tax=Rhipicephalus microplus TaxID=6941 RepID=A0A9J6EYG5_RHIMP|nr:hypothetical protein HPB51_005340 [Rhipicephalus microplus]
MHVAIATLLKPAAEPTTILLDPRAPEGVVCCSRSEHWDSRRSNSRSRWLPRTAHRVAPAERRLRWRDNDGKEEEASVAEVLTRRGFFPLADDRPRCRLEETRGCASGRGKGSTPFLLQEGPERNATRRPFVTRYGGGDSPRTSRLTAKYSVREPRGVYSGHVLRTPLIALLHFSRDPFRAVSFEVIIVVAVIVTIGPYQQNHDVGEITGVSSALREPQSNRQRPATSGDDGSRASPAKKPGSAEERRTFPESPCWLSRRRPAAQTTLQKSLVSREHGVAATCHMQQRNRQSVHILHSPSDPMRNGRKRLKRGVKYPTAPPGDATDAAPEETGVRGCGRTVLPAARTRSTANERRLARWRHVMPCPDGFCSERVSKWERAGEPPAPLRRTLMAFALGRVPACPVGLAALGCRPGFAGWPPLRLLLLPLAGLLVCVLHGEVARPFAAARVCRFFFMFCAAGCFRIARSPASRALLFISVAAWEFARRLLPDGLTERTQLVRHRLRSCVEKTIHLSSSSGCRRSSL